MAMLTKMGHDCHKIKGSELEWAEDTLIVKKSLEIKAVILTTDRDFFIPCPIYIPTILASLLLLLENQIERQYSVD